MEKEFWYVSKKWLVKASEDIRNKGTGIFEKEIKKRIEDCINSYEDLKKMKEDSLALNIKDYYMMLAIIKLLEIGLVADANQYLLSLDTSPRDELREILNSWS